ncbi:MAG: GNAT family N-acetyltransferase [Chitinophagaceae bacterium]|nr:GNAT family N-acetyltransferase [Chitinophagaceae bacterium]
MIFELDKNDFVKILPMYLNEGKTFPLILAVIHQKQPGWVFVDDPVQPTSAMIMNNFGFLQLVSVENFERDFIKVFKFPGISMPSYLLWYSPPPQIQEMFDGFLHEHVRKRERARFIFKKNTVENLVKCPDGFNIRRLDKELIKKTLNFKLDIGSRFWASIDDFLEQGIGVCVMKGGEIASLCYSACVVDDLAEIDIVTQKEYRGIGLAAAAAQSFMTECVRREIIPTWDCFVNNIASMKLAAKLGFEEEWKYYFYSFNLPINLPSNNKEDYQ